jgi:hypothetical protein
MNLDASTAVKFEFLIRMAFFIIAIKLGLKLAFGTSG